MKTLSIALCMVTSTMLLSGCNKVYIHEDGHAHRHGHEHYAYGPPPHAPAHGYRHKHGRHTLEYNYDLGVYIVIGLVDHYYIDNNFYKRTKHGWYSSHNVNKGWRKYKKDVLPGKLHRKYGHKERHAKHNDDYRNHRHGYR